MDGVAATLVLDIGLRGLERVERGIERVASKIENFEAITSRVTKSLALAAATATVAIAGIAEASENQNMEAMLSGLTDGLGQVERQMSIIDRISSKGIFNEDTTFQAVAALGKWNAMSERSIRTAERLGAIKPGGGGILDAAEIVGQIRGGLTFGIARRLRDFGVGPDKLKAARVQFDGREITSSPEEILKALDRIADGSKVLELREHTLSAATGGLIYQFGELLESMGTPLIDSITWVTEHLTGLTGWVKSLNNSLGGKLGAAALVIGFGLAIKGMITAMWSFVRSAGSAAKALELIAAGSAAGGVAGKAGSAAAMVAGSKVVDTAVGVGIGAAIAKFMFGIGKAIGYATEWTKFIGIPAAGIVAEAAAPVLGSVAVIGAGLIGVTKLMEMIAGTPSNESFFTSEGRAELWKRFKHNTGWFGGDDPKPSGSAKPVKPAERVIRRSDVERIWQEMHGKAWTG